MVHGIPEPCLSSSPTQATPRRPGLPLTGSLLLGFDALLFLFRFLVRLYGCKDFQEPIQQNWVLIVEPARIGQVSPVHARAQRE